MYGRPKPSFVSGKVTVVKIMAIQVIVQCMFFLPYPKTKQFKEIIFICFYFIWDDKIDKIYQNIKINDKVRGG